MSASQTNMGVGNTATLATSTPTAILTSDAIAHNSAGRLASLVAARRVSDGASKVFALEAGFKCDDEGVISVFGVTLLNPLGTTLDLLALSSVNVTIDSSDDTLQVIAVGINGQTIDWSANLTGLTVDHA